MRILAVDTTGECLGLSLLDGNRVWKRHIRAPGRHDDILWRETERLLARAGWALSHLDALAAANGPGSFTGIRVGMTFVSMLAQSLERPPVAVTLFEAQALRVATSMRGGTCGLLAVVFPARREELFFQVFDLKRQSENEIIAVPAGPPLWVLPEAWPKTLSVAARGRAVLLAGPAATKAAGMLKGAFNNIDVREMSYPGAEYIALAAANRLGQRAGRAPLEPSLRAKSRQGQRAGRAPLEPSLRAKSRQGPCGEFFPLYLHPAYYERKRH